EFLKGYGNYCEESAIERLLNTKFEPGKQRGKTVKVKMTMKIYFNQ
ncbi:MAG: energy transducer TonB, partial [Ignavibacteriales bacterium]|nr:energy transducer TonB [Ignavibacteriales bacterium]